MFALRELIRNLAWFVLRKTDYPGRPCAVFIHRYCGSKKVVIVETFLLSKPVFQCLQCRTLVPSTGIGVELVDQQEQEGLAGNSVPVYGVYS